MSECLIQVQTFGGLRVTCGGIVVGKGISRSHKVRNLLAYLLCNRSRMIPVEELIRVLGNDRKDGAPVHALRTMLYRIRQVFKPMESQTGLPFIVSKNGTYGWNPEAEAEVDAARFETMYQAGLPEGDGRGEYCRQLLALYQGDFLSDLAGEQWVEPLAEYYRELYLLSVEQCAPVLIEEGFAQEAADACRAGIRLSPYREPLYGWLMRAYDALGDAAEAAAVYEELRTLLYKDLGILPGEETQRIYRDMVLRSGEDVLSPDDIRAQLREYAPESGAFLCDFTSFKLFYQAEARAAMRRGDAIHIGVLSVRSRNGGPLPPPSLKRAMEQLHTQIHQSLRTGDIASCCSPSQYVLMLVQANYENSKLVCERVVQAFFRAYPRSPVRIQTVVFPLEPAFGSWSSAQKRNW